MQVSITVYATMAEADAIKRVAQKYDLTPGRWIKRVVLRELINETVERKERTVKALQDPVNKAIDAELLGEVRPSSQDPSDVDFQKVTDSAKNRSDEELDRLDVATGWVSPHRTTLKTPRFGSFGKSGGAVPKTGGKRK